jgi:hypothetical protein
VKLGQLVIPANIMALPNLTFVEKSVLAAIKQCELAGEQFNQTHFAEESGIPLRTISNSVRILRVGGHYASVAYPTSVQVCKPCVVEESPKEEKEGVPLVSFPTPLSLNPLPQEKEENPVLLRRTVAALEIPDWLPAESWAEFCQYRGRKFSRLAASKAIKKLDSLRSAGNDPAAVIDQTIANGWSGLFPLSSQGSSSRSVAPSKITNSSPITGPVERTEEEYQQYRMLSYAQLWDVPVESLGTYAEFEARLAAESAAEAEGIFQ